ncbi:YopX family protein [Erysipelotrichaceae bacterium HCN-30851]
MKGFRVWDKKEQKMHYDEFLIGTDGELYKLQEYVNLDDKRYLIEAVPAAIRRYMVMQQYIQCDRNGVPLYEQDIVINEKGNKVILDNEKIISLHAEIGSYICIGNTFETGE